jgi:acetyl-CoA acetyltransferase
MSTTSRLACLAGVGETRYAKWGGIADASEYQLACQAIVAAAADAGLAVDAIDGLVSFAADRNDAAFLAADLGIAELRFADMVWLPGGGGACAAVAHAAMAVESGHAETVAVFRSLCQGQFHRFGRAAATPSGRAQLRRATSPLESHMGFTLPFGLFNAPAAYAMVMRRHMHLYGTRPTALGAVALACRTHAHRNPRAVMRDKPMTLDDHAASRMIADPFRLFDCCLESDGACAVIVTTAERARDLRQRPVRLLASAQGALRGYGWGPLVSVASPDDDYASGGARLVARRLWQRAGVDAGDIDVAEIYDHFSGLVLLTLEDFGLCARGESGAFAESGALLWPNGALPTNTHGGSLSEAYIHGMNHIAEGIRQLRGASRCQVENAALALVTSAAGVPSSALVLARA